MDSKIKILIGVLVVGTLLVVGWWIWKSEESTPQNGTLSDEELLNYAKSPFDKGKMMGKDFILGYHNGIPVRVSFPCSDICPDNTIRIIRYNVSLSECESVGGEIKSIYVPVGIGRMSKAFCFPKIIVENNIYEFVSNVVIFTDKAEYEKGEEIKVTVINNFDKPIYYHGWSKSWNECGGSSFKLGKKIKEEEFDFFEIGLAECLKPIVGLGAHTKITYSLDPKGLEEIPSRRLDEGTYKWEFAFGFEKDLKSTQKVYSNEFAIKENENILQTKENYKIINQSDGIQIQILSEVLPEKFREFKINGWMGSNEGITIMPLSNGIIVHSQSCCQGNYQIFPYFIYITNPDKKLSDYIPIPPNIQKCNMQTNERELIKKPDLDLLEEGENYKVYSYKSTYSLNCATASTLDGKIIIWYEKDKDFLISWGKESGITGSPTVIHEYFDQL